MTPIIHSDIEKTLLSITKQILLELGQPHKKEIKLTDSLHRQLGIDSLGRAELFQRIEKQFGVSIPDQLLTEADTLLAIANFLADLPSDQTKDFSAKSIVHHAQSISIDPKQAHTLVELLFLYAEHVPERKHIYFYNEQDQEEEISYGQLLTQAVTIAGALHQLGLKEGETVAIMLPTHPHFFYAFYGILLAGAIPVPIYPPFRMYMLEAYAKQEAKILKSAQARILITFEQAETLSLLLKGFVPSLNIVTTSTKLLQSQAAMLPAKLHADNFALIQYTSGSTNDPKGVLLNHANLLANIRAYGQAIHASSEDVTVSWLPLYHDLGLIGMWLGSLYHGAPLVLLTPFTFLNHPERWLWAIHYHRATVSGAPNFAYELCLRKIQHQSIEGLDLSSWRLAANGAEKVYPSTLEQFAKKFAAYGFKSTALLPVYGLAESTVGLALPPVGRSVRIDQIERDTFETLKKAVPTTNKDHVKFVSCGQALPGHQIKIVDAQGKDLPERMVGRLWFRGPSNMLGYFNNPQATGAIYHDGWLDSGDLAYIAEGELYITGRSKDVIIKTGRNLYPAEIEELVGNVDGVRQGCVVAFADHDVQRGTEHLIVVAETRQKKRKERDILIQTITAVLAEGLDIMPDRIILVSPHVVPKTSSGKLQRAACKKMYQQGNLGKAKLPPWLQIIRLGMQWLRERSWFGLQYICKFIYTIYTAIWLVLTFIPLYFIVRLSSPRIAAKACQIWSRSILRLALCPVMIKGRENLTKTQPVIFTANHASYIDTAVMVAFLPINTRLVGKKEAFTAPILRTFASKLGYIPVDRMDLTKGVTDIKQIEAVLRAGDSVLIFPEGTFGYAEGLRPFRLGAFKVAVEAQIPIVPIALQGTRLVLRDDEKMMRPNKITLTVCPPIFPEGDDWQAIAALKNTVRNQIAQYCGETSLDYIVPERVATKRPDIH